jgi:hypothetical protein
MKAVYVGLIMVAVPYHRVALSMKRPTSARR